MHPTPAGTRYFSDRPKTIFPTTAGVCAQKQHETHPPTHTQCPKHPPGRRCVSTTSAQGPTQGCWSGSSCSKKKGKAEYKDNMAPGGHQLSAQPHSSTRTTPTACNHHTRSLKQPPLPHPKNKYDPPQVPACWPCAIGSPWQRIRLLGRPLGCRLPPPKRVRV